MNLTPPRADEVLPRAAALLNVTGITTLIGTGNIYHTKGNALGEAFPDVDGDGRAGRIVLMAVNPQVHVDYIDKSLNFRFKVRADWKCGPNDNPDAFLANLQGEIYKALQQKSITLNYAKQLYGLWRLNNPVNVLYEKEHDFYYQASEWSVLLTSKDN